jgi:hypothetical protein
MAIPLGRPCIHPDGNGLNDSKQTGSRDPLSGVFSVDPQSVSYHATQYDLSAGISRAYYTAKRGYVIKKDHISLLHMHFLGVFSLIICIFEPFAPARAVFPPHVLTCREGPDAHPLCGKGPKPFTTAPG